ncbi:Holliday junction recognition protein [Sturnira hondurensis]|uniref:Holliday junction recognition protein n=1 Tax=Sturnira hondurensis TaxID=192404 RepID=UPI00187A1DE7|nr:Holliday junction recognition protein [Sturnira hondurensis]
MGSQRVGQEGRSHYLNRGAVLRLPVLSCGSEGSEERAMENEVLGDDELLQKLRDSRRRFQRHMQQLLEKYNQAFEDAPVVQMSTLTYETPQGLRVWGGGLVKKKDKGQIQGSPEETASRNDGPVQSVAGGDRLPTPSAQDLGLDWKSGDANVSLHQEDLPASASPATEPWSPLKDELRRKYLSQADGLLQDLECDDYGGGNDTHVTLASPSRLAHDVTVVLRDDSVSWRETSGRSFTSSQSFAADDDLCNVTVSDLYAGMLRSMSQLLSARPSCVISTRTFVLGGRSSRRRPGGKSRANRTYCRGSRPVCRGPRERPGPQPEPVGGVGALRECQNLRGLSGQGPGLKLERASCEVNKLQFWKELKGTPQKLSSWAHEDCSAVYRLNQENRLMALKWLISPVKIVPRPRMLQGERGGHHRDLKSRFDKLYREYCLSPRKQPCLTYPPSSSGVLVHRGASVSPGGPQELETHRPSRPFSKAKPKSLNEAFENLGTRALEAGRWLPKSDSSLALSKTESSGHWKPTADLFQGNRLGTFRKSASLTKAFSVPGVQPLSSSRDHYDELKEKLDQLHQESCRTLAQRTEAPFYPGASPGTAGVQVQSPKDFLEKLHPGSGSQGPPKLPSTPQRRVRSPLGSSTVEVHPDPWLALAARCSLSPEAKRLRLSNPGVCGSRGASQGPCRMVSGASPGPREEVHREKRGKKSTSFGTEDQGFCVRKLEAKTL